MSRSAAARLDMGHGARAATVMRWLIPAYIGLDPAILKMCRPISIKSLAGSSWWMATSTCKPPCKIFKKRTKRVWRSERTIPVWMAFRSTAKAYCRACFLRVLWPGCEGMMPFTRRDLTLAKGRRSFVIAIIGHAVQETPVDQHFQCNSSTGVFTAFQTGVWQSALSTWLPKDGTCLASTPALALPAP